MAGWSERLHRWFNKNSRKAVLLFIACGAAVLAVFWFLTFGPPRPFSSEAAVVVIPSGHSTAQIADELGRRGLIRSPLAFRGWALVTGRAGKLKAGEYSFGYSLAATRIMDKLARGQVLLHPVTIPEGYNVAQITTLLASSGFADPAAFQAALSDAAVSGIVPEEWLPARTRLIRQPLEGYLFPDTYGLYRGITEAEIVRVMVSRLKASFPSRLEARAAELGMSVSEVLTLASIIEKEARHVAEREIISGVYHNRLRVGMKLDACPTVRYVMRDPLGPITEREMAIDSPYNTYVYGGLPPGPICSPGLASIEAALYPAKVDYFYFVAKPDGTHAFSRTYAEHLANIRKYR